MARRLEGVDAVAGEFPWADVGPDGGSDSRTKPWRLSGPRTRATLQYEIFFNEDETEAIVFERYRDADAALDHFANIGHRMEPLMATAEVTGEVLGTPNEKMRATRGGRAKALHPWMTLDE